MKKHIGCLTLAAAGICLSLHASAELTADEIKQLGSTLTPWGAEVAGNADGVIPSWEGGLCTPPEGYTPTNGESGGPYIDPFAGEKPRFRITSANLADHADKLDAGVKELFARHPETFHVDVYSTQRTACYPQWVYDNTINNVRNPKLTGNSPGLVGAHAQIPFPIPKSGHEAMWNVMTRVDAPHLRADQETWLIDAGGSVSRTSTNRVEQFKPYWDNTRASLPESQPFFALISTTVAPVGAAGVKQLRHSFLNTEVRDPMAWSYVPGQRRVRLAPEFKYDTVSTSSGGVLLFDEISGFDGKMDKFDFVLKGKREMYIPANAYRFNEADSAVVNTANHANPDYLRFELRRVWVVEATLKPGERHVQKAKVYYLDEDSWSVASYNAFDHSGKIHKLMLFPGFQQYDMPLYRAAPYVLYDYGKRAYSHGTRFGGDNAVAYHRVAPYPRNYFTAGNLAGTGIR